MASGNTNYFVSERQGLICEYINELKRVSVNDLIDQFNVSPSTIRNDLATLEKHGKIRRTHGGAVSINLSRVGAESSVSDRMSYNADKKASIAASANMEIEDGDTIALLAGTTVMSLAETLTNKKKLTIVVNDLSIAKWVDDNTEHNVFVLGGYVRKHYYYMDFSDAITNRINVDKAFFSCSGFSFETGPTISDFALAASQRQILNRAERKILLCDSTKFGEITFANILSVDEIDMIITDGEISIQNLNSLKAMERTQFKVANQKMT
ncbi:MAG: DeoR/GlpR family DNA-binding transcription regulator [Eubacteriales bacterium]|nr:DeoR/GlpR family DNA-binding transcription regulator [Eubacteriales bacterium]